MMTGRSYTGAGPQGGRANRSTASRGLLSSARDEPLSCSLVQGFWLGYDPDPIPVSRAETVRSGPDRGGGGAAVEP